MNNETVIISKKVLDQIISILTNSLTYAQVAQVIDGIKMDLQVFNTIPKEGNGQAENGPVLEAKKSEKKK